MKLAISSSGSRTLTIFDGSAAAAVSPFSSPAIR